VEYAVLSRQRQRHCCKVARGVHRAGEPQKRRTLQRHPRAWRHLRSWYARECATHHTQHACWHAELLFDSTVGAHVALAPPLVAPVMHRHAPNPVALAHHHAVLTRLWTWCLQKQRQLDTASAGSASAGGATRRLPLELELAVLHRRCKGAKCARVVRPPSCTPLKRIDAPCVPCVGSTA